MKKLAILFNLLLFTLLINGQDIRWINNFSGAVSLNSVVTDKQGYIYVAGAIQYTFDADPGTGETNLVPNGYFDVFIGKYDVNGNLIWAKSFGAIDDDRATSIGIDNNNNVYTYGYFQETVDFNPGSGVYNLTSVGTGDLFISKLDPDGNFIWAKQLSGGIADNSLSGRSLCIDSLNNCYITGEFFDSSIDFDPSSEVHTVTKTGHTDGFLLKLDQDGKFIWVNQIAGYINSIRSVGIDNFNNPYISGLFGGQTDFDPSSNKFELISPDYVAFIAKYNPTGAFIWAKQLGGSSQSFAIDPSNNAYIVGNLGQGAADFNPGPEIYNLTNKYNVDVVITKLNSVGDFVWAKQFKGNRDGQTQASSISVDLNSNVYTTGAIYGTNVDFDPNSDIQYLPNQQGGFLSTLDKDGNFISVEGFGATYSRTSINQLQNKINIIGGNGSLIMGYKTDETTSIINQDIILTTPFPNPAKNFITFEIVNQKADKLIISTYLGESIIKNDLSLGTNQIDVSNLQNGIYFYRLTSNNTIVSTGKFIIQK